MTAGLEVLAGAGRPPLFACVRSLQFPDLPAAVARAFSPRLQQFGRGCVVFDVSGLGRLLGDAHAIGAELQRTCAAHASPPIAVAVAPTQTAAMLLSLTHPSLTVRTGDPAPALSQVPLDALRLLVAERHGIHPDPAAAARVQKIWDGYETAFAVLRRWGLTTAGELAALPAADLSSRLGGRGTALRQLSCGVDLQPLIPDAEVPRFLERIELEWPIDGLEPLSFVLARLLDPLALALERADRGAAAIHLTLRLVDRSEHARCLQLPAAMRDAKVLRTLLTLDLESHPPAAAIDVVTIEVDPAPGRVLQYSLLERARPSAETLATLTARLGALVGESRAGTPRLRDTWQPDGFEMRRFAPDEAESAPPYRPFPARPLQSGSVFLRRFRPPLAIRVGVERGRPVRVAIDRRGMPGGIVEQCAGPWRTSGAWWSDMPSRWDRDEWDVAFGDGSVCRVFCERGSGHWFLDAVVD
jgi:protein ImuB